MMRSLSTVRENTPFAIPPRMLVVAEESRAGEASLWPTSSNNSAQNEIRFGDEQNFLHNHSDAVIVAGPRGYRVARHHPVLENIRPQLLN